MGKCMESCYHRVCISCFCGFSMRFCRSALWQDRRGNVAIMVALLALVLVMISGAAVDFGRSYFISFSLQARPVASSLPNSAQTSFRVADRDSLLASFKSAVDQLQQLKLLNEAMATAGNPE